MTAGAWTLLEVAKLGVSALTPVLLFVLGLVVNRAARRVEDAQWSSRKIIEKRLEVYSELAPLVNDIYCFISVVGHYASMTPHDVIQKKRDADKIYFVNRALFDLEFQDAYAHFIDAAFEHFTGHGQSAKIRADLDMQHKERPKDWDPSWDDLFSRYEAPTPSELSVIYDALMNRFAESVGVRTPQHRRRPWLS